MYKYDTHVHTSEVSFCAGINAARAVNLYKDAGYHGIVITDHYTGSYFNYLDSKSWEEKIDCYLQGYRKAHSEGQKIDLNVILGMEIQFDENYNDYLVYGFNEEFLFNNPKLYTHTLKSFKQFISGTSILIYQAHPFRSWVSPAPPKYLDGVEVFNGSPRYNSKNNKALSFAGENNLKMISGSDFHEIGDLATGSIVLPEMPVDSKGFAKLLKDNRVLKLLPSIYV